MFYPSTVRQTSNAVKQTSWSHSAKQTSKFLDENKSSSEDFRENVGYLRDITNFIDFMADRKRVKEIHSGYCRKENVVVGTPERIGEFTAANLVENQKNVVQEVAHVAEEKIVGVNFPPMFSTGEEVGTQSQCVMGTDKSEEKELDKFFESRLNFHTISFCV